MAYAATLSLLYTFYRNRDNILNYTTQIESEFDSIFNTLERLDDECYRGIDRSEIHELDAQIRDAAWKLEDVVDSHRLSHVDGSVEIEQEIHSFFETAKKLGEEYERALQNSSCVAEEDIIDHDDNSTAVEVGVSELSEDTVSRLLDANSEIQVFSIWGMAGIGKTHLARLIYYNPLLVHHFDVRVWVRIGPVHKDVKRIIVDILSQIERKARDLFMEKDEEELKDLLRSLLHDRTYLIVFDDMWSKSVLIDCLNALSHNENDGCKALITTRIAYLAEEWSGNQHDMLMPFLSDEESWDLLKENVFGDEPFPTQLEKPGRKIAEICEGLPLLILVVADILRGLDETEECWNKVAERKTSTFPDAYDHIYKVLIPSYDYLPQKHKACFLYLGVFPHSHQIHITKYAHLLMFEGLVVDDQVLLVFLFNSVVIGCMDEFEYACKLHSVYWYVCVTEARKTKLFHVLIKLSDVFIEMPRRLSVQNNMLFGLKEVQDSIAAVTSLTRSLLFTGEYHRYPVQICFNTMMLIKVLNALQIRFYEFPNEVTNLKLVMYLTLTHNGEVPSCISKLQHLYFLILRRHHNIINIMLLDDSTTCLPKEIWCLEKLEYLQIMGSKLPNPSHDVELPNLKSLYVNADSCTESVFRGTHKLEKLGIKIQLQPENGAESLRCLQHIGILKSCESLKCVVMNPRLISQVAAPPNHLSNLPASLKKLSFNGLGYPWKYISAIASLPNLETLKLRCYAFEGAVWEINDEEFLHLKYLLLEDIDVVKVTVNGRGLENLRDLILRHCYKLKTILVNHNTYMERIVVDECNLSIMELAQQMKDDPNNNSIVKDVIINHSWNL